MNAARDDIVHALALLDPAPPAKQRTARSERAGDDLEAILRGERDVEDTAAAAPARRRRVVRLAIPVAASAVGLGLLARALLGDVGEPQLGDPAELMGEQASEAAGVCRDAQREAVGNHGHDVPGAEAFWAARVLLTEQRGDHRIVLLRPQEAGESYLAFCILQRGDVVVRGVGEYRDTVPFRLTDSNSGPAEHPLDQLVWGLAPSGAVSAVAETFDGEPVEVQLYPETGVYTLAWPLGERVAGEIRFTLEDDLVETVPIG